MLTQNIAGVREHVLLDKMGTRGGEHHRALLGAEMRKQVQQEHYGARSAFGVSDQYIVLDSYCKLRESAVERGEFRWNLMVQGVTGDEVVGVRDTLDSVIEVQIAPFYVPMLPEVPYVCEEISAGAGHNTVRLIANGTDYDAPSDPRAAPIAPPTMRVATPWLFGRVNANSPLGQPSVPTIAVTPWVHNPYSQLPFGGRVTLQIKEAGLQSYSDRGGARHHFELDVVPPASVGGVGYACLASPAQFWDTYVFTTPLHALNSLTLVFRGVDAPVRFEPDVLYATAVVNSGESLASYTNGGTDSLGLNALGVPLNDLVAPVTSSTTTFLGAFLYVFCPGHNLRPGDRVFFSGWKAPTALTVFPAGAQWAGDRDFDQAAVAEALVNRAEGWVVTAGLPDSGAPDETAVVIKGPIFGTDPAIRLPSSWLAYQSPITVHVAKRRIRIPLRVRRLVAHAANGIVPV